MLQRQRRLYSDRVNKARRDQACLRPRDRFWDIPAPKIDSAFDNLFVPQPSWSPSTTQQLRKLVAAPYLSPNDRTPRLGAYFASPLALCARRVSSAASRLLGSTSLRFALHGWQRRSLGYESQQRANRALFEGLEQQQNAIEDDARQLERLQSAATGAVGQMEAIGYANQLASQQANQLLHIRGLLIAQQNAVTTRMQAQMAEEARQQAATNRLRKNRMTNSPATTWGPGDQKARQAPSFMEGKDSASPVGD